MGKHLPGRLVRNDHHRSGWRKRPGLPWVTGALGSPIFRSQVAAHVVGLCADNHVGIRVVDGGIHWILSLVRAVALILQL